MNIFALSLNVKECAQMHNDKHCVKMILEYSQLRSTAHRILDGKLSIENRYIEGTNPARYRKTKVWKLNSSLDNILYQATHVNHPSAIWTRESIKNYTWLSQLLTELCKEYTYRYDKIHKCEYSGLVRYLQTTPVNIKSGEFTQITPAMPKEYIIDGNCVESYRNYYNKAKQHLASWKGKVNSRNLPNWFIMENSHVVCKLL